MVKAFKGWLHLGRWGSVSFSVPELLKAQGALRWGWNKCTYLGRDADEVVGQDLEGRETTVRVDLVDEAISSPEWWAWLAMMEKLCCTLRALPSWVEQCPCHAHLMSDSGEGGQVSPRLRRLAVACPLRGRRASEVSTGKFINLVRNLSGTSVVELVSDLPRDTSPNVRADILQAFDLACAHLQFYFATQLSYWEELPWAVVQISDSNEDLAKGMLQHILDSDDPHPILF